MDEVKNVDAETLLPAELAKIRSEQGFFTAEELAQRNNVHIRKVYRVLRHGGVKKAKVGGAKFYYEPEFITCLEKSSKRRVRAPRDS